MLKLYLKPEFQDERLTGSITDAAGNTQYDIALDFSSGRVEIEDEAAWQSAVAGQPLQPPERRARCVALLMAKVQHTDVAVQAEGLHGLWELAMVPAFAHEVTMGARYAIAAT